MSFIRVYVGGKMIEQCEMDRDVFTIGRSEGNDLVLSNPQVSSLHASILRDGPRFLIKDNDSKNGTYLNGKRVSVASVQYWDELQIVNYMLKFMALPHAIDDDDPDLPVAAPIDSDQTVYVNLSSKAQREKLRTLKLKACGWNCTATEARHNGRSPATCSRSGATAPAT